MSSAAITWEDEKKAPLPEIKWEDEKAQPAKPAGPAPTTANNSIENAVKETNTTPAWKRLGSGLWDATKGLVGGMTSGMPDAGSAMASGARIAGDDAIRKAQGRSVPYRAVAGLGEGLGINAPGMEDAASRGDMAGIIGQSIPPAVAATSSHWIPKVAGKIGGIPDALGEATRMQETGKLKPSVRALSRATGAGVGGMTAGGPGAVAGTLLGPSLADMLLPEHPNPYGEFSKIPSKFPKSSIPSATGMPNALETSATRPAGRMVLTPGEFNTRDVLGDLAKKNASRRGMDFAGGMTPMEGRKVPRFPTATQEAEYPRPREITKFPKKDDDE
jgi:hypothetical protein